ncbi:MAG: hypothetical protein KAV82_14435 [Phycisphaerae bacterium]|nr:hypothetical protein [Phycisphaerae bacterium]
MRYLLATAVLATLATTTYGAAYRMNFTDNLGVMNFGQTMELYTSNHAYIQVWLELEAGEAAAEAFYKLLGTDPTPTNQNFVWTEMIPGPDLWELNIPDYSNGIENWASYAWAYDGNAPFEGPGSFLLTTLAVHCLGDPSETDIAVGMSFPGDYRISPDFELLIEPDISDAWVHISYLPEPASLMLLVAGGLVLLRRR